MKIILYIGHHKVGSTALQIFLAQNWLRLAQAGILYPSVESSGLAHTLKLALDGRDQTAKADVNFREPHSALAYRMISEVSKRKVPGQFKHLPAVPQMIRALHNQVAALKPRALILCSEVFSNFGQVEPQLITRLHSLFPEAEFELYCALRRPDDYMISWHGQRLKVGERAASLQAGGIKQYLGGIHFDYRMVIESWIERIPNARLILRNYSDILAAGGSTEDFAAQIGLDLPDTMMPAGRANTGLPRAAFAIMQQANEEMPPPVAHALSRYFQSQDNGLTPARNSDVELFGAQNRSVMADRFAPIHRYLGSVTGRDLFFPDIEELSRERPIPEAEASRALLEQIDPAALPNDALRSFITRLK